MTAWEPGQYERFAAERAQPLHDLLALLGPGPHETLVDLGCGPATTTVLAADTIGAGRMLGIDDDPAMLAAARARADGRCRFEAGDLATWTSDGDVDVVLATAGLHWVPDHPQVLAHLGAALAPGGRLLVQVPAPSGAAFRRVAVELAAREPYVGAIGDAGPPPDPVLANVLAPDEYSTVLHRLGLVDLRVELRVYAHTLPGVPDAVEWVKGSTLTRFGAAFDDDLAARFLAARFLADYTRELTVALDDARPLFFPFPRILMAARRPA